MNKSNDQMLDDLFDLGRKQAPQPSEALMARVLLDSQAAFVPEPAKSRSLWDSFFELVGGWPSIGGMAVAGVTGVWFGIAPPSTVSTFAAELIGTPVTFDLLADTSGYFSEATIDG